MVYDIQVHPLAEVEIWEAVDWYDEQKTDLGKDFARELDRVIAAVRSRPFSFPEVAPDKRQSVFRRFPYVVVFEVRNEVVNILAVFHTSRNPKNWRER